VRGEIMVGVSGHQGRTENAATSPVFFEAWATQRATGLGKA